MDREADAAIAQEEAAAAAPIRQRMDVDADAAVPSQRTTVLGGGAAAAAAAPEGTTVPGGVSEPFKKVAPKGVPIDKPKGTYDSLLQFYKGPPGLRTRKREPTSGTSSGPSWPRRSRPTA